MRLIGDELEIQKSTVINILTQSLGFRKLIPIVRQFLSKNQICVLDHAQYLPDFFARVFSLPSALFADEREMLQRR